MPDYGYGPYYANDVDDLIDKGMNPIDPFEDMYRGAKGGITSNISLLRQTLDRAQIVLDNDAIDADTTDRMLSSVASYMNLLADEIAIYRRCMAISKATLPYDKDRLRLIGGDRFEHIINHPED